MQQSSFDATSADQESSKIVPMATTRDDTSFPTFWRLQALGWIGLYAVMVVFAYTYVPHISVLWDVTIRFGIWFFASWALRPLCRVLLQRSLPWLRLELWIVACSSLTAIATAFLIQFFVMHFRQWNWAELTRDFVRCCLLLLLWCNLYFSIKQWQRSNQEREHLARAESDAREARLSALRYQLNPHFLFNSLNAISTLAIEGDIPGVTRTLAQLADLLRVTLDGKRPLEVSFSEEMAFTQRYLAIEQIQLGERLQVELSIAAETVSAAVPSMLLQPLVENAVRHGIEPVVGVGKIGIRSVLIGKTMQIVISNTGPRIGQSYKSGGGIGLTNTVERLQTLYGPNHKFEIQWPETGGCDVLIEIPFRRVQQRLEESACAY